MRQRSQLARTLGRDGQHLNYITISKSFNMKCLVLALLVVGAAAPALAQDGRPSQAPARPRYAAALVAGASQFDLSGTGTTPVVGARVEADCGGGARRHPPDRAVLASGAAHDPGGAAPGPVAGAWRPTLPRRWRR